jgi:hypothetical protein
LLPEPWCSGEDGEVDEMLVPAPENKELAEKKEEEEEEEEEEEDD